MLDIKFTGIAPNAVNVLRPLMSNSTKYPRNIVVAFNECNYVKWIIKRKVLIGRKCTERVGTLLNIQTCVYNNCKASVWPLLTGTFRQVNGCSFTDFNIRFSSGSTREMLFRYTASHYLINRVLLLLLTLFFGSLIPILVSADLLFKNKTNHCSSSVARNLLRRAADLQTALKHRKN